MKTLRAIKASYLDLHAREKLLLAGFFLLAAIIWLSSFGGRARDFGQLIARNLSILNEQEQVLFSKDEVELRAASAAADLVPGRTLDGTQLLSQVDSLRRTAGLANATVAPLSGGQNLATDQLALNSVQIRITGATWPALKQFYSELQRLSPYVSIDAMTVALANQDNGGTHNVQMTVSSVQVKE